MCERELGHHTKSPPRKRNPGLSLSFESKQKPVLRFLRPKSLSSQAVRPINSKAYDKKRRLIGFN